MICVDYNRLIAKSTSVGLPCRIIYTATGFTVLVAFALNRLYIGFFNEMKFQAKLFI